jgi:hypothetical protein
MTIEFLLGHSTEELASLTDEQLLEKFKDVFSLEPKPEGVSLILEKPKVKKPPKDPNRPTAKPSKTDKLKSQLMELEGLLGDLEEDKDNE